ncbi:hypothetical protein [Tunturiibacter psychrotolerans]|uniref:hypothetical protein n=1 Tax=Tunturiibacter psychrotolerans TaxID=3069686 RepID=UPI003D19654D
MTLKITLPVHSYLFVLSVFAIAAINPPFLLGQVVQIGTSDPNFCEKAEHVKSNLQLSIPVRISGRVVDQAGAPLKTSKVELRSYLSAKQQMPVKIVTTDGDGRFDPPANIACFLRLQGNLNSPSTSAARTKSASSQ